MIICDGLSKFVTPVGWSNGFPVAGSNRTFHTGIGTINRAGHLTVRPSTLFPTTRDSST